jgi:hypothetical protein
MPREDCRSTLKYNCKLRANRTLQSDYESGSPAHGRAADALKQKLQPKALRYEQAPPASTAARRALRLHTRATQCHACAVYGLWVHAGLPRAERQRRPRQRGRWIPTRVLTSTVVAQASAVDHAESSAQAELRGKRYPHWSTQPDTPISSLLSLNRPTPRSYATHVRTRKNALVMSSHAPQYVHTSHTARSMPRASLPNLGTVIDLPSFSTHTWL